MEKLCIDVRGFSEEKKKRVQDAFFELGYEWFGTDINYRHLDAVGYTNKSRGSDPGSLLLFTHKIDSEFNGAITYPELMRKAGLDESDPDAVDSNPITTTSWEEDFEKVIQQIEDRPENLSNTIHGYIDLLDMTDDPKARDMIVGQLERLMDLEFKKMGGEYPEDLMIQGPISARDLWPHGVTGAKVSGENNND